MTDEDIQHLMREAEQSGLLHKIEREMVEGVLDLENRTVRTIMTPRPDVAWVDLDQPKDAIVSKIRTCPYAQLLASRGSIDEIAGVVRKQDLLEQILGGAALDIEVCCAAAVVPEGASVLRTLDLFRKTPVNTAVVVDEYGTVQGIVTRTDLLVAVAGDLPDVDVEFRPESDAEIRWLTSDRRRNADFGSEGPARLPRAASRRFRDARGLRAGAARPYSRGGRSVRLAGMAFSGRRYGRPTDRQGAGRAHMRPGATDAALSGIAFR